MEGFAVLDIEQGYEGLLHAGQTLTTELPAPGSSQRVSYSTLSKVVDQLLEYAKAMESSGGQWGIAGPVISQWMSAAVVY